MTARSDTLYERVGQARLVLWVVFFAVAGALTLVLTRAATPYAKVEIEAGTASGTAATGFDINAAAGTYVLFDTSPTGTGCAVAGAVFCEDFEGARNTQGNRNGDFSISKFSAARFKSQQNFDPNWVERASIPSCRQGSETQPFPPGESLICQPSANIGSRYGLISAAHQNYGDSTYRLSQPFDIAGRTGTIKFDTSLYIVGGLFGWPTVSFTQDPVPAPSITDENSLGGTAKEGIQVHFSSTCPGPSGWTAYPKVRTYSNYNESFINDTVNNGWCTQGVTTRSGSLNRVEIRLSQTAVEIWASDYSTDGVSFGPLKRMYAAPISLSFSRGYVSIGSHNHATAKYSEPGSGFDPGYVIPSWTVFWDNISFDGPSLPPLRTYQVDDATIPQGQGMIRGYRLPSSEASALGPLSLGTVTKANATGAKLTLNMWADIFNNPNHSTWRLNYRFNSGAWRSYALSAEEIAHLSRRQGGFALAIPVSLNDIGEGANTLQFYASNMTNGYGSFVANVDLVLE